MLATISGNTNVVKKMLLKGADKHIKNENGQTAMDIALENKFNFIRNMLTDQSCFNETLNIKTTLKK